MSLFKKTMSDLSLADLVQITKDYKHLETYTTIGDCKMRETAEIAFADNSAMHGIFGMHAVSNKAFMMLADLYISENNL